MTTQLVVVAPPAVANGFRLAGALVRVALDPAEAEEAVLALIKDGERGVIAVYEPFLDDFEGAERSRLLDSLSPVLVALPAGLEADGAAARKARLAGLLQRAVGYHITFGSEEP
jgi:vacuolar-type H+-ATPase subunit F/Vma7